jgi:hypothetical protein
VLFSAVDIVTKLGLEDRGFVVRFRVGKRDLIVPYSPTESGPNLPPTLWVSAILTVVVKRSWLWLRLSPSIADVKTACTCT